MEAKSCKVLIVALALLASCVKDKPELTVAKDSGNGVLVLCEGQYSAGNASIYRIDPTTGTSTGDLFKAANGNGPGDVLQSAALINGNYWLALNNSSRVTVIDSHTFKQKAQIPVRYPRFILQANERKVFVSTLYSKNIYIIDPISCTVTDSVVLPDSNPEGMCMYNKYLFVATWDTASNSIWKVNTITNVVEQKIEVSGYAPHDIMLDQEQKLWVLSGNATKGKRAAFTRIDPSTGTIIGEWLFNDGVEPVKPVLTPLRDSVYFIEVNFNGGTAANGIYKSPLKNFSIPDHPFIQAIQYQYFWALGIHTSGGNVFVGDPKGFNQAGAVLEYNRGGELLRTYKTGVGPGAFVF